MEVTQTKLIQLCDAAFSVMKLFQVRMAQRGQRTPVRCVGATNSDSAMVVDVVGVVVPATKWLKHSKKGETSSVALNNNNAISTCAARTFSPAQSKSRVEPHH